MNKPKTETELKREILDYLEAGNILAWRNQSGTIHIGNRWIHFGKEGSPDIVGCWPTGRFFCIEAKKPGEKPSDVQKEFHDRIRSNNGLIYILNSIDRLEIIIQSNRRNKLI